MNSVQESLSAGGAPWEFDSDQPRIEAPLKSRFRHYQNLKTTASKIRNMLTEFRLTTMTEVLAELPLENSPTQSPDPVPVEIA